MTGKSIRIILGICMIGLAACAKPGGDNLPGKSDGQKQEKPGKADITFAAEDYQPGNAAIRKTDKGYYYLNRGLRYWDSVTGKDMYLCNKPECRHDGNEFCVATNEKYKMISFCVYDGKLIASMVEETETQYLYKLFSIAPDGSQMNELMTYFTVEKGQMGPTEYPSALPLMIHRNKVILPMTLYGQEGLEDTYSYGTAIYDLDTKKLTFLDAEPVSRENLSRTDFCAYGDYIFFCRKKGKRTILHRYNLTDGTEEEFTRFIFNGMYAVLDENTIAYGKVGGRSLCVYHHETGESEEKSGLIRKLTRTYDGVDYDQTIEEEVTLLRTDGTYVYAFGNRYSYLWKDEAGNQTGKDYHDLYVYNKDFEEVAVINMEDYLQNIKLEGVQGELRQYDSYMSVLENEVYWCVYPKEEYYDQHIIHCKLSDFLAGAPQFELAYSVIYQVE